VKGFSRCHEAIFEKPDDNASMLLEGDEPVGAGSRAEPARTSPRTNAGGQALAGGGPDGNEVLTTTTGAILIVLLAVLGVTILRIGQLITLHLFLGLLVIGPIALKLASTGYRFVRYYTHNAAYRLKGPPWTPLRLIAPIVVLSTVVVLATGIGLLIVGPSHRSVWLLLHKVSFIVWVVFTALHIVGHVTELGRLVGVRADLATALGPDLAEAFRAPAAATTQRMRLGGPGSAGRAIALTLALLGGLVLAVALIPDFGVWHHYAILHHRRDR
jgi:hypothetical protein